MDARMDNVNTVYPTTNKVCGGYNYCFPRFQRGFHRFPRGVELFSGVGVKMIISLETYRTYAFTGGSRPYPTSGSAHALIF